MKNTFSWGNYDYSNLSDDIVKNIKKSNNSNKNKNNDDNDNNEENTENNSSNIKQKVLNPIKNKFQEGVDKIQSTKIYSTISNKFKKEPIHSNNPSGIVINKENSYDIISKITEKEKYMKELENKEETNLLMDNYIEHDKETGLPIVSEYQLNCIIDDYKDKVVGKDHVIFYKCELFSSLSGKRWDLYHSHLEFKDLYMVYNKFFLDVPEINFDKFSPKIVNQPLIHKDFISQLNVFINAIIKKPALITSCYVIKFLKLENHFSDISLYQPLLLYDSTDDRMNESVLNHNKLSINAIYYLYNAKLLFIGTGENEGETMYKSMMKKINYLFKSKDPTYGTISADNKNNICKGQFITYNIINSSNGEIMFVELKCIDVISEVIKFDYWFEKNYVTLCLKNGQILIFKIYINEPSSTTKEIIEYIGTINEHFSIPLCCIINFQCGYTYSFGQNEKNAIICDVNYQNMVKEVNILTNKKSKGLICIDYTISLEYIYAQGDDGSIYFIDIINDYLNPCVVEEFPKFLPDEKNSLGEKDKGKIIQINNSFYLLIGGVYKNKKKKEYNLSIYSIQISDKINLVKLREIYLGGNVSITDVNINNNEDIIIAISNGSICIFNKSYNSPEYIIDAHLKKVTGFIWIENQKMIITASLDKAIKVYQFPLKWPAEFLRKNKHINKLSIMNEIKSETKNLYEELYSSYKYNNNDGDNNGKHYGDIWNVGNNKKEKNEINNNEIISDFWKYQKEIENKRKNEDENKNEQEKEYYNQNSESEDDDENERNENDIVYPKPDKYDDIDIIFCDDLNGWSKPKRLID